MNASSSLLRRPALVPLVVLAFFLWQQPARGDAFDGSWTSNDGVTIRARLAGWDGAHFILVRNGRDYRVAASRLSKESVSRARRLLAAAVPREAPALPSLASLPDPAAGSCDRHGMRIHGFGDPVRRVRTTAYASSESDHLIYGDLSAAGTPLRAGRDVSSAAADWSLYPLGTVFRITGMPGLFVVDDYGSALVGNGTIDLYQPDLAAMHRWGCRQVEITIMKWGSLQRSAEILASRTHAPHCLRMLERVNRQRALLRASR